MARARALIRCCICGKEFCVEKEFIKRADADSWVKYMESRENMRCDGCAYMEYVEQRQQYGIQYFVLPRSYGEMISTGNLLVVYVVGNSFNIKEKLKEMGFRWGRVKSALDVYRPDYDKGWRVTVSPEHLDEVKEQLKALGAVQGQVHYERMLRGDKQDLTLLIVASLTCAHEKENPWTVSIPAYPSFLRGKSWNGILYKGEHGKDAYLDGEQYTLSADEEKEYEAWINAVLELNRQQGDYMLKLFRASPTEVIDMIGEERYVDAISSFLQLLDETITKESSDEFAKQVVDYMRTEY